MTYHLLREPETAIDNPPKKGGTWKKLIVPAIDEKYPKVGHDKVGRRSADRYTWSDMGPYKWHYKGITGVITLLVTGRVPPCQKTLAFHPGATANYIIKLYISV